jgi:hypothetical protein
MKPGVTLEDLRRIAEAGRAPEEEERAMIARVAPSWTMRDAQHLGDGWAHHFTRGTLQVLLSLSRYDDGRLWIHVSVCGRTGQAKFYLPSWEELKRVKNDFIGVDRWAYQVFPPASEYVNDNANVLHLFALHDGTPALPDFTHGIGAL